MESLFPSPKKLGFGLMRLPLTDPDDAASVDLAQTSRMIDTFYKLYVTLLLLKMNFLKSDGHQIRRVT